MKSDIDEVALQGIEFWSNVCDEEMDLAIEATEVSRVVEQSAQILSLSFSPPPPTHTHSVYIELYLDD